MYSIEIMINIWVNSSSLCKSDNGICGPGDGARQTAEAVRGKNCINTGDSALSVFCFSLSFLFSARPGATCPSGGPVQVLHALPVLAFGEHTEYCLTEQ